MLKELPTAVLNLMMAKHYFIIPSKLGTTINNICQVHNYIVLFLFGNWLNNKTSYYNCSIFASNKNSKVTENNK